MAFSVSVVAHDVLVFGRAAGVLAGLDGEGARRAKLALAPAQRDLHQLGRLQIAANLVGGFQGEKLNCHRGPSSAVRFSATSRALSKSWLVQAA